MKTTQAKIDALDNFTRHYLIAALWSATADEGEPLGENYELADLSDEAVQAAINDCAAFRWKAAAVLPAAYEFYKDSGMAAHPHAGSPDACAGHDFSFTRNREGVGFWDRGMNDDLSARLTEISQEFPEVSLYAGDDGCLYFE